VRSTLPDTLQHVHLGTGDYRAVLALQRDLHAKRVAGIIDDLVLTVEHNPVFTLGRSGSRGHILVSQDVLDQQGIEVHTVERGGDITYHGPGQLVVYPIVDLRGFGKDIHRFIASLEESIIQTLKDWDIDSARKEGFPGVWVGQRKIASVGVHVKQWVTYHGAALNIHVNPKHFRMIRPCGLSVDTVSVNEISGTKQDVERAADSVTQHLGRLLERDIESVALEEAC